MSHYLVVYRRSTGRLQEIQDLGSDRKAALKRRFERERQESSDPDIEVVLLSASSRDALKRTHGRYFKDVRQLATDVEAVLPR